MLIKYTWAPFHRSTLYFLALLKVLYLIFNACIQGKKGMNIAKNLSHGESLVRN